jgi:hypothetical protein
MLEAVGIESILGKKIFKDSVKKSDSLISLKKLCNFLSAIATENLRRRHPQEKKGK